MILLLFCFNSYHSLWCAVSFQTFFYLLFSIFCCYLEVSFISSWISSIFSSLLLASCWPSIKFGDLGFYFEGHTWRCSGIIPDPVLRNHFTPGKLREPYGVPGIKPRSDMQGKHLACYTICLAPSVEIFIPPIILFISLLSIVVFSFPLSFLYSFADYLCDRFFEFIKHPQYGVT